LIIVICLIGGLINRKTKDVAVTKSKYFYTSSIITVVIVLTSLVMEIIKSIGNIYLSVAWFNDFNDQKYATERLVGSILMLLTMVLFSTVIIWPSAHAQISKRHV
jgi:hypothetical protein